LEYLDLAIQAVKEAEKIGAHHAEAYVLDAKSLTVEVADQAVESLKFANDTGIGVRVISPEGRVGFAFSTDIAPGTLAAVARQAIANGLNTSADRHNVLPAAAGDAPALKLLDPKIAAVSVEEKIEMAKQVEAAARQADSKVRRTERCAYEDVEYGVALANSRQLTAQYRSGYCGLYGVVLAEADGDVQPGMGIMYCRDFGALNPQNVGREAAFEAARLVGAKNIGTTQAALVLSPHVATNFFAVLIPALSADAVQKGRSLFKNKIDRKVASSLITLLDDGRLDGGIASAPVDGEGVLSQRTALITDGVLQGYLYNTVTANRDGVASTGNGVRHSFKGGPEVGPTNIFIQPGARKPAEIIGEVRDGFYVTSVMGMHTANPISGDFSVGATGVWIKDGEFAQAVRGVVIAGNILELMEGIDAVGEDLRFFGSQGAPTVRINQITISGS
jgi:PmbA protein